MTNAQILWLLAGAHIVAAVMPGLNTLLMIRTATRSRRLALWTAVGMWPAGVLWAAAGMGGLGALLAAFPSIAMVFRLICGAYVSYLGLKMLRASLQTPDAAAANSVSMQSESAASAVGQGFLTNVTGSVP